MPVIPRMRTLQLLVAALVLATLPSLTLRAQAPDTRADRLRQAREEKANLLAPPESPGLERGLLWLENGRLFERLLNPAQGLYPVVGSVTTGGGFALGPGYRRPKVFGGAVDLSFRGAGTFARYWMIEARATMPRLAGGRVAVDLGAQRYDFPSEEFFGIGPDSRRDRQSTYGLRNLIVGGGATLRPHPLVSVTGRAEWLTPRVSGDDDETPIHDLFTDESAPGLARQPDYMRYLASAEVNYREPLGNPRRGGRYVAAIERHSDQDFNAFSFSRVDLDLQQYIPLFTDRRVLALRAHASSSRADEGHRVPFYLQRTLGGPDDLRGFRRFRFRDSHLLLVQAEYRWEIFTAVDGAIFYDVGAVAPRWRAFAISDRESDYGIGFRFGTVNGVFLRIEGAFGSTGGKHFVLRYGHVF